METLKYSEKCNPIYGTVLELLKNLTIYGSVHELFDNYRFLERFENYCLNIYVYVSDFVYVIIMSLIQYMYFICICTCHSKIISQH